MDENRPRVLLPFALLIAILAVSTASIFIRFAQKEAPSLTIAALRLAFASIALTPVALARHRAELQKLERHDLWLGLLSGLFLAIHFGTWITSLEYTTVASSVVLVSTGPLWVALLSPYLLKEKLSGNAVLGLILALLGGIIIALAGACVWNNGLACPNLSDILHERAMWGNFLALAGAWALTGYLIIGRKLRGNMSLVPYIFLVYGMAAIGLLVAMLFTHETPFGYAPITYVWLLLLAFIPQLIGHSTYNWALRFLPASLVAITTLGEPVGSAILAFFILQEVPSWLTILGGVLILAGIYIVSRQNINEFELSEAA